MYKISQQVGTKGKEIRGLIRREKKGFSASDAGDNAKDENKRKNRGYEVRRRGLHKLWSVA